MKGRAKGIFVNTNPAVCSIHESGRMVFDCIKSSDQYDLEYITLDELLRRIDHGDLKRADKYDFFVLNYHPFTMAPYLTQDQVRALPGKSFTIVLEVEPDNPIAFAPEEAFDGFIVLDPTAVETEKIVPFARPLEHRRSLSAGRNATRKIPWIGSFGFGTPGKGFELLVEAVNREFDRATVRINVPPGTYTDEHMFNVHQMNYAAYLADLCRRIAKPGIEVDFTHKVMTPEGLLEWCGQNDLNCFMYTRRQSGLSATTDQAIISGRPLVVSSNDTFRHIHRYIDPYPRLSLRGAIEKTTPAVKRMQEDWSVAAFSSNFHRMLRKFGILRERRGSNSDAQTGGAKPIRLVVASPDKAGKRDPIRLVDRVSDALGRTRKYEVIQVLYRSLEEVMATGFWRKPAAIILVGDGQGDAESHSSGIESRILALGESDTAPGNGSGADGHNRGYLPRIPIIPFYTASPGLPPGPHRICLIGFPSDSFQLVQMLAKIQREQPNSDVFIETAADEFSRENSAFRASLAKLQRDTVFASSLQLMPFTVQPNAHDFVHTIGTMGLTIFYNDPDRTEYLLNLCELSMTTERAVAFTRNAPFAAFGEHAPFVEDHNIYALTKKGAGAKIALYRDFFEGQFFNSVDRLLSDGPAKTGDFDEQADDVVKFIHRNTLPVPNSVLGREDQDVYSRLILATAKESERRRPDELSHVLVQQGFVVAAVRSLSAPRDGSRLLCIGDAKRRASVWLEQTGYVVDHLDRIESADAEAASGTYDIIFGVNALGTADDARRTIGAARAMLASGGRAIFTFFHRHDYAASDQREPPDFPTIATGELQDILQEAGAAAVGPERWMLNEPRMSPDPFASPPVATLIFTGSELAHGPA